MRMCSVDKSKMADRGNLVVMRQALETGQNVVPALQNLNTLLEATSSRTEVLEIASFMSLQLLFSCLNTADEKQIKPCCAVLDKIFSNMSPLEIHEYSQYIELGLQHYSAEVKKLSLWILEKNSALDSVQSVILAPTMFHLVTQCVGEQSLECAKLAMTILLEVAKNPKMMDVKLKQALLIDLEGLMGKNDTVRYRVYEIAVKMTHLGGEAFAFIHTTGLLQKLISELELSDVLVKMNCLELLVNLLDSNEGAQFLEASQVLAKLHSLLLSSQQDPFGSIIVPGILKFFGYLSRYEGVDMAAVCTQYPEFMQTVLAAVYSPEDILWGIAVDTLGALGSTEAGRKALATCDSQTREALKRLGSYIASGETELRTRILGAVAMLMSCKEDNCSWEASKSREWFDSLHPQIFPTLMTLIRQPFVDLRTAGLKLLLSLAPWEWGQSEMHSHPGFLEYLLDRRTEPDKIGRELKYDIVHALVVSGSAESVFGGVSFLKLRQYDREGPFFFAADTTVGLEGST